MKKKDYSISLVRLIAFCMIVSCHICSFYGHELASWLNSGVQVFLIMSGFLYGRKEKVDAKRFYKRNIPKILIDYYLYVALMIPVYLFIVHRKISTVEYLQLALGIGTDIPGMGHLWYISTILVCYFLTPLALRMMRPKVKAIGFVLLFVMIEICFAIVPGFTGAWINCFLIGLLLGNGDRKIENKQHYYHQILVISLLVMAVLCGTEILMKYHMAFNMEGMIGRVLNTVFHYGHISIALVLFFGILRITKDVTLDETRKNYVLEWSDQYSYDGYLVHLFFILGPYSFFNEKGNSLEIAGAVFALVLYIIVAAFLLRLVAGLIKKGIKVHG